MKRLKLYGKRAVRYSPAGRGVFNGVMFTYCQDRGGVGRDRITYVLRAGRKGTGREVARASCVFCAIGQEQAFASIKRQVGGEIWDDI